MSESRPEQSDARLLPKAGDWIVDRFQIIRVVGRGGFGTVYEARQESMGHRRVALKILAPRRLEEHNAVERFRQEALLASRLHHPNTITLFDFGATASGLLYIAMEYLEGEPLSNVLRKSGPLPPRRAEHVARQVLGALSEAHAIGLIHRDLKPDNVFLTRIYGEQDFVKVLDFGLAKVADMLDEGHGIIDLPHGGRTDLTMEGLVCGTPDFMAPEQAQGVGPLTSAVDVYAVGLLIFQMLTGNKPFIAKEPMEVLKMQVSAPLPALPAHVSAHRLAAVMEIATRKRASERYADASAMLQALNGQGALDPLDILVHASTGSTQTRARVQGLLSTVELDEIYGLDLNIDGATSPELDLLALQSPTIPGDEDEGSADQPTTGAMQAARVEASIPTPPTGKPVDGRLPPESSPTRPGLRRLAALPGLLSGQVPLIGREQEARQILGVVRSTADEGHSRLLLLEGDAGVGKSRLLTEIGRIVRETSDILVAGGHFRNPNAGAEEGMARLVGQLFGLSPERGVELARAGSLEEAVAEAARRFGDDINERDVALIAGLLVPEIDSAHTRHPALAMERLVRLLIRVATAHPIFLVFEDLQFADPTSLDLLRRLASSVARHARSPHPTPLSSICLTLTVRRQSSHHRPDVLRLLRQIEGLSREIAPIVQIEGLADAAILQLVDALLPSEVKLKRRVAEAAHGNPLHVLQILHHLHQSHRLVEEGEIWLLRDESAPLSLPQDLLEMVRLRVTHAIGQSSAPEGMQELLYRLAVLGRQVPMALLRTMLDLEERPWPHALTDRLLGELKIHHLVGVDAELDAFEVKEAPDPKAGLPLGEQEQAEAAPSSDVMALDKPVAAIRFENGLLPELLQREVDTSLAGSRLHSTAARAKIAFYGESSADHADELAAHLIRAGMPDKALPHLLEAGRQRLQLSDLLGARAHFVKAKELLSRFQDSAPPTVAALAPGLGLAMGQINLRLGQYGPAEEDLLSALALAEVQQDHATRARAALHLGELHLQLQHHEASAEHLRKARAWVASTGDPTFGLEIDILLGQLTLAEHGVISAESLAHFEVQLEAHTTQAPLIKARGLQHLGNVHLSRGDNIAAERFLARARLIADEVGDPGIQAPICADLGHALLLQGRTAEGEGLLRQALQIDRESGDRLELALCLHRLALAAWHRQAFQEATELLDEALDIQRDLGVLGHLAETLALMGRVHEARGEIKRSRKCYLEVLSLPVHHKPELIGDMHLRLGSTNLKLGRVEEARKLLEQASLGFASANNPRRQIQSLNLMAMAASWSREPMQAAALLERSDDLARRHGDHAGRVFALAALALISFINPLGGLTSPRQYLERAAELVRAHKVGPVPLLQTVGLVLDGHGLKSISDDLPPLQRKWLEQIIIG